MRVREMRMRMTQRLMAMNVAVRALRHRLVGMIVMAVVVNMGMFVLDCAVQVLTGVIR